MKRRDCRVTLACGCAVLLRNTPINDHIRYPCPSNMGHGYTLRWTSWCLGDFTKINESEPSLRSESNRCPVAGAEPVDFEDVKPGDRLSFGTHSAALRRHVWREGVVTRIDPNSVRVYMPDGTGARLNRDRWSIRGVSRLP